MIFWHCPVVYLKISVEKYSIVCIFKICVEKYSINFIFKNLVLKNTRSFRNVKFLSRKILDCISIPKSCVEKYSIELHFAASHGSRHSSIRMEDTLLARSFCQSTSLQELVKHCIYLMYLFQIQIFCLWFGLPGSSHSSRNCSETSWSLDLTGPFGQY